jgi:hypothetical protein
MPPFDEHAAHLPPPRADEPANLRREIIDELSDHLTCARKREQLAGGPQTEEAIQHRVLNRFGDPAAVARKLWLDWMWEKIMTQRILTGVCILLTLVTCTALAFAWVSINRQQDLMADLQLTSQTQLQEQQKQFERLLVAAQSNKAPSDWNPVELRFVKGKEDGPPAEGIRVTVAIRARETGIPPMEAVSNEEGVVRFPRVRYGTYRVTVRNAADESLDTDVTLQPGEGLRRTIVCPDPLAETVKLTARVAWPADLAEKPLWFRFQEDFVYRPLTRENWKRRIQIANEIFGSHRGPLIAPNGDTITPSWQSLSGGFGPAYMFGGLLQLSKAYAFDERSNFGGRGRGREPMSVIPAFDWPGDGYVIGTLEVLLAQDGVAAPDDLPTNVQQAKEMAVFHGITLNSADWSYRIEPGAADKPGTLWLTPTADAIEKVRAALAEIDQAREAAEKAEAEAEKARTESSERETKPTDTTDPVKKPDTDP